MKADHQRCLRELCKDETAFQQAMALFDDSTRQQDEILRRYERLVSASSDAVALVSPDYVYLIVNDTYVVRSGKQRDEIVGHTVTELMGGTVFRSIIKERLDSCLKGETIHYQDWFDVVGNKQLFLDVTYAPCVENRDIIGVVVTSRDFTNIKQAEEKLAYQAHLLDIVGDAVISTDADFHIVSWNKSAERIYGWRAEEVVGKHILDILPTEYPNGTVEQTYRALLETGQFEGEFIQRHRDGSQVSVHSITSIIRGQNGDSSGAVSVNRDIRTRKEAEQKLAESEAFLRTIYEGIQSGIVVLDVTPDQDFRYVGLNSAYARIINMTDEQIRGKTPEEIDGIERVDAATLRANYERCLSIGSAITTEDHFYGNGRERWLLRQLTPVRDDTGRIYRIIGFALDITERKQAETSRRQLEILEVELTKERELRAFQSRVLSMITHDFKTPLAAIMTSTDLMRRYSERMIPPNCWNVWTACRRRCAFWITWSMKSCCSNAANTTTRPILR